MLMVVVHPKDIDLSNTRLFHIKYAMPCACNNAMAIPLVPARMHCVSLPSLPCQLLDFVVPLDKGHGQLALRPVRDAAVQYTAMAHSNPLLLQSMALYDIDRYTGQEEDSSPSPIVDGPAIYIAADITDGDNTSLIFEGGEPWRYHLSNEGVRTLISACSSLIPGKASYHAYLAICSRFTGEGLHPTGSLIPMDALFLDASICVHKKANKPNDVLEFSVS